MIAKKLGSTAMAAGGKAHKVTKNMSEKWGADVEEAEKRVKDELENNTRFHRTAARAAAQNSGSSSNSLFDLVNDNMGGGSNSKSRGMPSGGMQPGFSEVNAESIRRVETKLEALFAMMRSTKSAAAEVMRPASIVAFCDAV